MEIRKAYDRVRTPTKVRGESLTHQAHKKECDINQIMKKWERTGVLEHRNTFEGQYGDFTETPGDYHEAMNQVTAANEMFESLPAKIRRRFGNDPGAFLDFAQDPENGPQMVSMGLAAPKVPEEVLEPSESLSARATPKKPAPKTDEKSA